MGHSQALPWCGHTHGLLGVFFQQLGVRRREPAPPAWEGERRPGCGAGTDERRHTHHGRLGADGPSATVHTVDFTSRVDFIRFPFYHPPPYWFYLIGERSIQKINLTYSGYL